MASEHEMRLHTLAAQLNMDLSSAEHRQTLELILAEQSSEGELPTATPAAEQLFSALFAAVGSAAADSGTTYSEGGGGAAAAVPARGRAQRELTDAQLARRMQMQELGQMDTPHGPSHATASHDGLSEEHIPPELREPIKRMADCLRHFHDRPTSVEEDVADVFKDVPALRTALGGLDLDVIKAYLVALQSKGKNEQVQRSRQGALDAVRPPVESIFPPNTTPKVRTKGKPPGGVFRDHVTAESRPKCPTDDLLRPTNIVSTPLPLQHLFSVNTYILDNEVHLRRLAQLSSPTFAVGHRFLASFTPPCALSVL